MDDKPANEIGEPEMTVVDETADAEEEHQTAGGLLWRIGITLAALVVIGILLYPLVVPGEPTAEPHSESAETGGGLTPPQVTIQADAGSAQAQFELGNAYAQEQKWPEAMAAYQKAIELDPSYQAAYANLGVVYYQLEQLDLAASQYQKALELSPEDGDVAYNLGALYLQQALISGDQPDPALLDQAVEQLNHALELSPELVEPYFTLGVAYQQMGRREEAIEAFETFLAHDSVQDSRAVQDAQRYLETLRNK